MNDTRLVTVFGGTGFIGHHLVDALLQRGHRLRIVTRRRSSDMVHTDNVSFVSADLSDEESLRQAIQGSWIVFHLATGGGDKWEDFARETVRGTGLIGEACLNAGVERLIYTSSSAALQLGSAGTIDEAAGTDAQPDRRSMYSRAKISAERVLLKMHAERGLPVVILRPAVVLGAGGPVAHAGFGVWPSDICCIGWGTGKHPLPLVLVDDVVAALISAMDAPGVNGRCFNLAGDVRISARDFVALLAQMSKRRYRFYPRPLLHLQLVDIGKWILKVLARKPGNAFPSFRDLSSNSLRTDIDCTAAKRDLGWRPVADRQAFIARAILPNLRPVGPDDLRMA